MQQIQVQARPRPRHTTPADLPTINRKIAHTWFPESQPPAKRKTAGKGRKAWTDGGYHAFSADGGTWCAISSAGEVLTGSAPDELDHKIRAHWQAMQ